MFTISMPSLFAFAQENRAFGAPSQCADFFGEFWGEGFGALL